MRSRAAVLVLLLACSGRNLPAQEVSGHLEAWLVDSSGTPAAGAELIALREGGGQARVATADPHGFVRLRGLPVGAYRVLIRRIGSRPVTLIDVAVVLGRTTALGRIVMAPAGIELPDLVVAADPPLIDLTTATTGTTLDASTFDALPVDRGYLSVLPLMPHANASFLGDEVNVAGGSGMENAYFVDGVNLTDPVTGNATTNLPHNFVSQVQLITGGWEAEYGRALGGVVNVVTRSGTNQFESDGFAFFTGEGLSGTALQGAGQALPTAYSAYDIGVSFGGPVVRDRLWYYLAYNPSFESGDLAFPGLGTQQSRSTEHLLAGKLTWQPQPGTDLDLVLSGDPGESDRSGQGVPALFLGSATSYADPEVVSGQGSNGGVSVSLQGRHQAGANLRLSAALSGMGRRDDLVPATGAGDAPVFIDLNGVWSGGYGARFERQSRRLAATLKAELLLGDHNLEVGAEYEHTVSDGRTEISVIYLTSDALPYNWFQYSGGGEVSGNYPTLYAQDGWQLSRRLRLTAGLRWDGARFFDVDGGVAQTIGGMLQPRIGFVYGLSEAGSARLFGSAGAYYEQVPLNLAGAAYARTTSGTTSYPQDPRQDTTGAVGDPPMESGPGSAEDGTLGQRIDEYAIGFEFQVGPAMRAGARGSYRHLRWAIEDAYDPVTGYYGVGNPGRGQLAEVPRATRDYSAVEFTLEQPFDGRFGFLASYVISRLHGNYTGLFASDLRVEGGNIGPQFDVPDGIGVENLLPSDRPHVLKAFGIYRFDFGLTVGATALWQSGTPLTEYGASSAGLPYRSFLGPRGTAGRMPSMWNLDLRLGYEIGASRKGGIQPRVLVDLFHLGSPRQEVDFDQLRYTSSDSQGHPTDPNPNYGLPTQFQPPMSVRVGLELGYRR